jgi:hypothetical protein
MSSSMFFPINYVYSQTHCISASLRLQNSILCSSEHYIEAFLATCGHIDINQPPRANIAWHLNTVKAHKTWTPRGIYIKRTLTSHNLPERMRNLPSGKLLYFLTCYISRHADVKLPFSPLRFIHTCTWKLLTPLALNLAPETNWISQIQHRYNNWPSLSWSGISTWKSLFPQIDCVPQYVFNVLCKLPSSGWWNRCLIASTTSSGFKISSTQPANPTWTDMSQSGKLLGSMSGLALAVYIHY